MANIIIKTMKTIRSKFVVLLMFFNWTIAHAACFDATKPQSMFYRTFDALPAEIKALTFAKYPSLGEIADGDGNFNATDVGDGPRRRYAVAKLSEDCAFVAIEHGGRGYFIEIWSFRHTDAGWVEDPEYAVQALMSLATSYNIGPAGDKLHEMAVNWYKNSAENGDADSATMMGYFYEYGRWVRQDYATAVEWYRRAAQLKGATAQYRLGILYARGDGVQQDDEQAALNWCASAAQGFAPAIQQLKIWTEPEVRKCSILAQSDAEKIAALFPLKTGSWIIQQTTSRSDLKPKKTQSANCESAAKVCVSKSVELESNEFWPKDPEYGTVVETYYNVTKNTETMTEWTQDGHAIFGTNTRLKNSDENFELGKTMKTDNNFVRFLMAMPVTDLENTHVVLRYVGPCTN